VPGCGLTTHIKVTFDNIKTQSNRRQQTLPPVRNSRRVLPVFIVEQNVVGISAVMLVVFYRRLRIHSTHSRLHDYALYKFILHYITSLHDAPWGHRVKTWRHPQNRKCTTYRNAVRGWSLQAKCTENLVKFSHVVSELCCGRTEKHT